MISASSLGRLAVATAVLISVSAAVAADNTPPAGFTALFNGKDLSGWKGLVATPPKRAKMPAEELAEAQKEADDDMRAHWKVEDGVIVFDGKRKATACARPRTTATSRCTSIGRSMPEGDSGIYLRGTPQVQIWDPDPRPRPNRLRRPVQQQKNPQDPLVRPTSRSASGTRSTSRWSATK